MRKILLVLISFFVIAALPVTIHAQDTTTDTTATTVTDTPTATSTNVKMPLRTSKTDIQTLMGDKISDAKMSMKEKIMQAKDEMKDKVEAARTAFKEKLQTIKDGNKQQILENLYTKINERNQTRTTNMSERLDRLASILTKISENATTLKSQGKDTANLNSLITAATTAVESAKTAVSNQAAKDYTIDITTDSALKTNAKSAIKEYTTDIKSAFDQVLAAHKAVLKAFEEAKSLSGSNTTTIAPTP